MSSSFSTSLDAVLSAPVAAPELALIKCLKAAHPNSHHLSVLQWADAAFPLSGYLLQIGVQLTIVEPETHSVIYYNSEKGMVYTEIITGLSRFPYESTQFRVYKATWRTQHGSQVFYHLIFEGTDDSAGQKLVKEVYKWANDLKEEIWVFEGGRWAKSKQLYKSVQSASWGNIVLEDAFKEGLRRDTQTFFASKDIYQSLDITWKRGILLLGPPGNGKTESIKALLKETECAAMYVKSFETSHGPELGVRAIFDHARKHSPCILVLEDLDAMVKDEVRSFFLNELDGLAQNDGILTIATTNHPERIDDAILNRPSRFDVKYTFGLPDSGLRKAFALKWIEKVVVLGPGTGVVFDKLQETASIVSEKTEGWSFAFLKELFLSFLLRVAHDKALRQKGADIPTESSNSLLLKQIDELTAQIMKSKDDTEQLSSTPAYPSMYATRRVMTPTIMLGSGRVSAGAAHPGTNF